MKTIVSLLTLLALVLMYKHTPADPRAAAFVLLCIMVAHDQVRKAVRS